MAGDERNNRTALSETMAKLAKRLLAEHKNLKVEHDTAVMRADAAEKALLEGQTHETELTTENEMLTRKESELHTRARAAEASLLKAAEAIESRDRTIAGLRDQLSLAQRERDEANEDAALAARAESDRLRAELSGALEMLRLRELRERPQKARQDETLRSITMGRQAQASFPEMRQRAGLQEWGRDPVQARIDVAADPVRLLSPQRKWTLPAMPAPGLSISMQHRHKQRQHHQHHQKTIHHYAQSLPNLMMSPKALPSALRSSAKKKSFGKRMKKTKEVQYAKSRFDLFG